MLSPAAAAAALEEAEAEEEEEADADDDGACSSAVCGAGSSIAPVSRAKRTSRGFPDRRSAGRHADSQPDETDAPTKTTWKQSRTGKDVNKQDAPERAVLARSLSFSKTGTSTPQKTCCAGADRYMQRGTHVI